MSEEINALLLGIIQGLTEFLPVSSSGHLELGKFFLGEDAIGEESLIMTVVLHFATALSTLVVFRNDIVKIIRDCFVSGMNQGKIFALMVLISMIPAVAIGLGLEGFIERLFSQNIYLVGSMLIITGLILFIADRSKSTAKSVNWRDALWIGIAQAIAIIPGISRSGATITASVAAGIDREEAARFSFLMVVPLIFGKIAQDILRGDLHYRQSNFEELVIGFFAAFLSGLLACSWMVKLVKASRLRYFSFYCFFIAIVSIIIYASR